MGAEKEGPGEKGLGTKLFFEECGMHFEIILLLNIPI